MVSKLYRIAPEGGKGELFAGPLGYIVRDELAECKVAAWDRVRAATGADYATNAVELRDVARRVHMFACNIQHEMGSTVAGILFAVAAALGEEKKSDD